MNDNTKIENTEKMPKYNKGLVVKISASVVTYINIARALAKLPEKIVFTKSVKKFSMLAFKDIDCDRIDFSTAVKLERIATKSFKGAKNIHWSNTLNCPNQEPDSFENAEILYKSDEISI